MKCTAQPVTGFLVRAHDRDDPVYGDDWSSAIVVVPDPTNPVVCRVYGLNTGVTRDTIRAFDAKMWELGFRRRIYERVHVTDIKEPAGE